MLKRILIIITLVVVSSGTALAITNIDQFKKWAWNDSVGWIVFADDTNSGVTLNQNNGGVITYNEVVVTGAKVAGSGVIVKNSKDWFSMDCATSPTPAPNQNICPGGTSPLNYFVANHVNGSEGDLAGWAWSSSIGWTSFCGNSSASSTYDGTTWNCPLSPTYQVKIIDTIVNGVHERNFTGYAWNDNVGWINFTTGTGPGANIDVKTYWGSPSVPQYGYLISNTFDTCSTGDVSCSGGVAYNYILWKGDLKDPTNVVAFKLATSNCSNGASDAGSCVQNVGWGGSKTSGDGAFLGPGGTSSDTDRYITAGPNIPVAINNTYHNNRRYYQYKIFIDKSSSQNTLSPVVTDVVINWSL